jgi:hypothetical protein
LCGDDRPVILLDLLLAQSQAGDERNIKVALNHRGNDCMSPDRQWKRFDRALRAVPALARRSDATRAARKGEIHGERHQCRRALSRWRVV